MRSWVGVEKTAKLKEGRFLEGPAQRGLGFTLPRTVRGAGDS